MLEDVRKIIAEQLGTDQDKVHELITILRCSSSAQIFDTLSAASQVQANSKFVDLGADSLDTVSAHKPSA